MVHGSALGLAVALCMAHVGLSLAASPKDARLTQKPVRHEEATVVSGRKTNINNYFSIQSDCSSNRYAEIRVLNRPEHGGVTTEHTTKATTIQRVIPGRNVMVGNSHALPCSTHRLPATSAKINSRSRLSFRPAATGAPSTRLPFANSRTSFLQRRFGSKYWSSSTLARRCS
jgi:hypothetical protein